MGKTMLWLWCVRLHWRCKSGQQEDDVCERSRSICTAQIQCFSSPQHESNITKRSFACQTVKCSCCRGFSKVMWSVKGFFFHLFQSPVLTYARRFPALHWVLLCVPWGRIYSVEHKEAAVVRTQTQLHFFFLSRFLAKTDGGRTERLIEKSVPRSLFHSSQRCLRESRGNRRIGR